MLDNIFVALIFVYFLDDLVDLVEDRNVIPYSLLVLGRKDMLQVILELLSANGANYVVCSGPRLFDALRVLFILGLMSLHLSDVVVVLLVQERIVLVGKLPLFLELEDGSAKGSLEVEGWEVVFTHIY